MTEVIPAILAKNINDLRQKIANVVNIARVVQIDICDGKFVESKSWPMDRDDAESVALILDEEEGMPYWENLDFEFDLMVKDAIKQFDFFVRLGAKRIIFHLEAENEGELKEFINSIDPYTRENLKRVQIELAQNQYSLKDDANKEYIAKEFDKLTGSIQKSYIVRKTAWDVIDNAPLYIVEL